jgi:hypothetical protein
MNQIQLQLAIPDATAHPQEITDFARSQLDLMRSEALESSTKAAAAFERAWAIGKACVTLKDKIGPDEWEAYATSNIGEYYPIYRCMRLARMSPDAPPLKGSGQYKQLQIALGNEPPPKTTPRKTDTIKFSNLKAALGAIRRWWREGDGVAGLDNETLREIRDDLKPIIAIYENIEARLAAE